MLIIMQECTTLATLVKNTTPCSRLDGQEPTPVVTAQETGTLITTEESYRLMITAIMMTRDIAVKFRDSQHVILKSLTTTLSVESKTDQPSLP